MAKDLTQIPIAPTRGDVEKFEKILLTFPQTSIRTEHYFVAGLYAREVHIPANTVVTGKAHLEDHLNVVSKGRIIVWTEAGMQELSEGTTITSKAGCKRVGLTLEDTVWVTIHPNPTNEDDVDKLEARLVEPEQAKELKDNLKDTPAWLS